MIYYNVIKRKSPKDGTVKFYASARQTTYATLDQVAENISRECTLTVHDIKAVLSSLQEQVILMLRDGKSVRFGDLDSFRATLKSKGTANKEDFKKSNVSRVMVRFSKSSAFDMSNKDLKLVNREEAGNNAATGGDADPNA